MRGLLWCVVLLLALPCTSAQTVTYFSKMSPPPPTGQIKALAKVVSGGTSMHMFAVGSGRIYHTINAGQTWDVEIVAVNLNAATAISSTTAWAVGDNGGVLKTTGVSWLAQSSGTSVTLNAVSAYSANMLWAVGALGKIIYTTNGGVTWASQTQANSNPYTFNELRGVVAMPTQGQAIAVGGASTVLRTDDAGANWGAAANGIPAGRTLNAITKNGNTPVYIFVVGNDGFIARSNPPYTYWNVQENGGTESGKHLYAIDSDPVYPSRLYAAGEVQPGGAAYLRYTTNDGTTWTTLDLSGTGAGPILGLGVFSPSSASDPSPVFLADQNGNMFNSDHEFPVVEAYTPAYGTWPSFVGSNGPLYIRFSERVALNSSGTISIFAHQCNRVASLCNTTIDLSTVQTQATLDGGGSAYLNDRVLTLSPFGTQWFDSIGVQYTLTLSDGVVIDQTTNKLDGYAYQGPTAVSFTVQDETGPTTVAFLPSSGARNVGSNETQMINITFSENIQITNPAAVIGFLPIQGSQSHVIPSFTVAVNSAAVSVSGNTLSIQVSQNLGTDGKMWSISIGGNVLADVSPNANTFAGLAAGSSDNPGEYWFQVTDVVAPTIVSLNPASGVVGVQGAQNLTVTFDEWISRGTGSIELVADTATVMIPMNDTSQVTIDGNMLTIDPIPNLSWLMSSQACEVRIPASAIADVSGSNFYAGTSPNTWMFTLGVASDATLLNIEVTAGSTAYTLSPAFSQGSAGYSLTVPSAVAMVNLTITKSHPDATVQVARTSHIRQGEGGTTVVSGSPFEMGIRSGQNPVQISVTAHDGTVNVYSLMITKEISTNAQLSGLKISSGSLSFVSGDTQREYHVVVPNEVSSVTLTASVVDSWSRVEIAGKLLRSGETSDMHLVQVGTTQIRVVVTAQAGNQHVTLVTVERQQTVPQCVMWRQTGQCNPYGTREPGGDQPCHYAVNAHWSGYCECQNLQRVAHSGCGHEVFTCADKCAQTKHVVGAVLGTSSADMLPGDDAQPVPNVKAVFAYGAGASIRDQDCPMTPLDVPGHGRTFFSEEPAYAGSSYGFEMTAASQDGLVDPKMCALGSLTQAGAWCSPSTMGSPWYQLDAGTLRLVAGVAISGRSDADHWVTNVRLTSSVDGEVFTPVQNNQSFAANHDRHTHTNVVVSRAFSARYVRIYPLAWEGHIALRAGLLLCDSERSLCGQGVSGDQCNAHTTQSGDVFYFADGYATNDPARGDKMIDYPAETFGARTISSSGRVYVGRGVEASVCVEACANVGGCNAVSFSSSRKECLLFSHVDRSSQIRTGYTTYYKF